MEHIISEEEVRKEMSKKALPETWDRNST
jgi:hypothetical protein